MPGIRDWLAAWRSWRLGDWGCAGVALWWVLYLGYDAAATLAYWAGLWRP